MALIKRPLLLSLAVMAAKLIELTMAANYTVGGPNGAWDTSTDFQTWASSQSFLVGDNLIFQYAPNHDVVEVGKADYDSCQTSKLVQVYNGGSTTIPLSSPGKRYFICGTSGHCSQGMKLEINTQATTSSPPPAASPPSLAPQSSSSTPTSSPEGSPESAPTTSPPLSSDSPSNTPLSSPIAPSSTEALESSPAPSAAPGNSKASFRASHVTGFGAIVMLLAF